LQRPARHPEPHLANPPPRKPPQFAQPAAPISWRIAQASSRAGLRPFNACRAMQQSSRRLAGPPLRQSAARPRARRHRQRPRLQPPRRFGHADLFRSKIAWSYCGFVAQTWLRSAPERRQAAAKSSTVLPQMRAAFRQTATRRSPVSAAKSYWDCNCTWCGGFEAPTVRRHSRIGTSNPKTTLEL
jgi:hypothetical protein